MNYLKLLFSLISVYNILLNEIVIATPTLKISKRSPDQEPSENIILNERDIQQDPKNLMVKREAIMEREKRRRTNIKGETSNEASRSIKDNVSSDQNQLKEKKKLRKSDNDDNDGENDENKDEIDDEKGSEENSTKLSKQQLDQIYRFVKNKKLYESLEDSDVNLPDKLIELLASRTAYDLALKWFAKLPPSSSSANQDQLEQIFSRIYHFLFHILKSAQSKLKVFEINRSPSKFERHGTNVFDYLLSKNLETTSSSSSSPTNWLYENLIGSSAGKGDNDSLEKYLEAFYSRFGTPGQIKPRLPVDWSQQSNNLLFPAQNGRFASVIKQNPYYQDGHPFLFDRQFPSFASNKKSYQSMYKNVAQDTNRRDSIRSFHHHFHVYEGPDNLPNERRNSAYTYSKPYNFGHQKSPVVCTNYPEHSTQGFKSFISVESCTQPSFLSHTGVPVFGHGCTFRFICEEGFHSIGGFGASIKCINGYWSSRAICLRDDTNKMSQQTSDMTGGQKSPDATQNKPTNTNVFHPNYIKRSADFSSNKKFNNRKKRSNNEDDDADDEESEKDETNDDTNNEDLSMDLNTLVEPNDNKLATNNEQLKSTTASPVVLNDEAEETQNIEDLNETEESDSFASIGQVKDENSNENRQDEKFDEDELKDKVTTPNAKLKIENEKTKASRVPIKWPLEIDNDLEKSIYEEFQELVDERN